METTRFFGSTCPNCQRPIAYSSNADYLVCMCPPAGTIGGPGFVVDSAAIEQARIVREKDTQIAQLSQQVAQLLDAGVRVLKCLNGDYGQPEGEMPNPFVVAADRQIAQERLTAAVNAATAGENATASQPSDAETIQRLEAEVAILRSQNLGYAERVAAQSELLQRAASKEASDAAVKLEEWKRGSKHRKFQVAFVATGRAVVLLSENDLTVSVVASPDDPSAVVGSRRTSDQFSISVVDPNSTVSSMIHAALAEWERLHSGESS